MRLPPPLVMAGLDPAVQPIVGLRPVFWIAAHVLGRDPGIKRGYDWQKKAQSPAAQVNGLSPGGAAP